MTRRGRAGYTVTEIMVTALVLGVLAALLLPGISGLRKASDNAGCINNLKKLGTAIHAYASDHEGYLPPAVTNNGIRNTATLEELLEPYIGPWVDKTRLIAADTFYCPANVRLGTPPKEGYNTAADGTSSYKGWSGYMFGYTINGMIHPQITYLDPDLPPVRLSQILLPSKVMSLADINVRGKQGTIPVKSLNQIGYFTPKTGPGAKAWGAQESWFGAPHGGWCHILFIDGHVDRYRLPQPLPIASLPGQERPWYP